jgi:integrase
MARVHLSDDLIGRHSYAGGTDYLWDADRRGFGVRTYPSGRKVWVLKLGDSTRVLGDWPTFELEEAWLAARRLQQQEALGRFGLPQAPPPPATLPPHTLGDLAREHAAWMLAHRKAGAAADVARRWERAILPALGAGRALSTLTAAELESWHRQQQHRKVWANRAMQVLRAGWNHAERWGWVPPSTNPLRHFGLWRFEEKPRERVLTPDEAGAVRARLEELELGGDAAARGLLLILYTGMRHQEAARLLWSEVHLEAGVLVIADHKASRKRGAKVVPLPDEAVALLARAPRDAERVFPLQHFYRRWRAVAPADATPHDVRRTLATRLDEAGVELHRIAQQLGQKDVRVTRDVYLHPSTQALRAVANRGAALMNH